MNSRIVHLASIIAENTTTIDRHLVAEGLPCPAFDAEEPPGLLDDMRIASARQAVLEATDELHSLMKGPIGILTTTHHTSLLSLQAIYRFSLATAFPNGKDGASFEEISKASGLAEPSARRILRHAMANHIFREPRKGYVTHTAASKVLSVNPLMREWIGMSSEEIWPCTVKMVDAMTKWPGSQEPNQTGFNIAHATQEISFNELAKHPARARRFADAMSWFSAMPGFEPTHILVNYPWEAIGNGTVVDVGGSYGTISIALVKQFPLLHCIVQDRSEVVAEGRAKCPPELIDRLTFMEHDFFTTQPVKGADVYYLRWILHDWSDKYSICILRSLIPALKPGARIVVNEHILPEPGTVSSYSEKLIRSFDLTMMELHNGKERDADDWYRLFQEADSRFTFLGVRRPASSRLGIVEACWAGVSSVIQSK